MVIHPSLPPINAPVSALLTLFYNLIYTVVNKQNKFFAKALINSTRRSNILSSYSVLLSGVYFKVLECRKFNNASNPFLALNPEMCMYLLARPRCNSVNNERGLWCDDSKHWVVLCPQKEWNANRSNVEDNLYKNQRRRKSSARWSSCFDICESTLEARRQDSIGQRICHRLETWI